MNRQQLQQFVQTNESSKTYRIFRELISCDDLKPYLEEKGEEIKEIFASASISPLLVSDRALTNVRYAQKDIIEKGLDALAAFQAKKQIKNFVDISGITNEEINWAVFYASFWSWLPDWLE